MKKKVKFSLIAYPSEWQGEYGKEEWAEAICPFCGTRCAVFLRDTAGKPDAVRFQGNIGLMNDIEGCIHLYGVDADSLIFSKTGRLEVNPFERRGGK